MDLEIVFVGTKFLYNEGLEQYALKCAKEITKKISSIKYYEDGDNSLFLDLEKIFNTKKYVLVFSTKSNFATVGKITCTIIEDNLVFKNDTLMASESKSYAKNSYLLEYNQTFINIVQLDEMKKMPQILLEKLYDVSSIQLFQEDELSAKILFETLSQTFEVKLDFITLVDGWIKVIIKSKKHGNVLKFVEAAKQLLPSKVIVSSNIVKHIIEKLSKSNKKISFAESCTGGLLTYTFTKENGASKILDGSLVTYSNHIKSTWLAVDEEVLDIYGAVSFEVVKQMGEGAINVSEADYAISISGIAGDTGGTPDKPVGTVFIGVKTKENDFQEKFLFLGDRNYVQYQSVMMAIKMLILSDVETFF